MNVSGTKVFEVRIVDWLRDEDGLYSMFIHKHVASTKEKAQQYIERHPLSGYGWESNSVKQEYAIDERIIDADGGRIY